MIVINGEKWACERCIRGHRTSTCNHTDAQLMPIKRKGRPATQCRHCRELRAKYNVHTRCHCTEYSCTDNGPDECTCPSKAKAHKKAVELRPGATGVVEHIPGFAYNLAPQHEMHHAPMALDMQPHGAFGESIDQLLSPRSEESFFEQIDMLAPPSEFRFPQ